MTQIAFSTIVRLKASSGRYALVREADRLVPLSAPLSLPVRAMLDTRQQEIPHAEIVSGQREESQVDSLDLPKLRACFGTWVARTDLLPQVDSTLQRVLGSTYDESAQKAAKHGLRFHYFFEEWADDRRHRLSVVWKVFNDVSLRKACVLAESCGRIYTVTAADIMHGHVRGVGIDPLARCLIPRDA